MNIFTELTKKNTYKPNLLSTQESSERTYRQALHKLEKITKYYNDLDITNLSNEDIYDVCCEAATDLALCCELFLKSIYIYENGLKGYNTEDMWNNLARPQVKDENGNDLYINRGIIYRLNLDENGNPILDEQGIKTYVDIDNTNNIVKNGQQGKKLQKSGHDLEYLISNVISAEKRVLLSTIITTNKMENTNAHNNICLTDILSSKDIIESQKVITESQYNNWLIQHAQTFVDARYAGQNYHSINIEFLYHLAIQCKVLAEYTLELNRIEETNINEEELFKNKKIIAQLGKINNKLITKSLVSLINNDEDKRKKLEVLIETKILDFFKNVKPYNFYFLIKDFDYEEITYIYKFFNDLTQQKKEKLTNNIEFHQVTSNILLAACIQIKQSTKKRINDDLIKLLIEIIRKEIINENCLKKENFENLCKKTQNTFTTVTNLDVKQCLK